MTANVRPARPTRRDDLPCDAQSALRVALPLSMPVGVQTPLCTSSTRSRARARKGRDALDALRLLYRRLLG